MNLIATSWKLYVKLPRKSKLGSLNCLIVIRELSIGGKKAIAEMHTSELLIGKMEGFFYSYVSKRDG